MRIKETVTVDARGDANYAAEIKLPAGVYTTLKKNNPNVALMLRKIGLGAQSWYQIEDIKGQFEDGTSTVKINCITRGMARMGKDHMWEVPIADGVDAELVSAHDNEAILTAAASTPLGLATQTTKVILPAGSKDIKTLKSPNRVAFRMPASVIADGSKPDADLNVEVKPQLMSALGKSYGNAKFSKLWVARSLFKNTGDQTLSNYQVRFRVVDYTSTWGPWSRVEQVVPGQTVVDAYFPVLDLEKLAKLNGTVPAMLEVEYQYKQADGQVVKETETKNLKILGHNEIFTSSMNREDAVDFYDHFDLVPIIVASFVTHDDPVIGQVAGWVSGQAGGAAAALKEEDAIEFMKSLYEFMQANKIAYQTSPVGQPDGQIGQHVKYGRDVLKNRAGTCIDLAIFYASVCDAVGLKSVVFVIPGHAFPAVELPSGRLMIVESTVVDKNLSFVDATKIGLKEYQEGQQGLHPYYRVDIRKLHDQGVSGLELPALPQDVLEKWGIHRVERQQPVPNNQQPAPRNNQQPTPPAPRQTNREEVRPHSLVGTWETTISVNGHQVTKVVTFDNRGNFRLVASDDLGNSREISGGYTYNAPNLTIEVGGNRNTGTVTWVNGDTFKYNDGLSEPTYVRSR